MVHPIGKRMTHQPMDLIDLQGFSHMFYKTSTGQVAKDRAQPPHRETPSITILSITILSAFSLATRGNEFTGRVATAFGPGKRRVSPKKTVHCNPSGEFTRNKTIHDGSCEL